ncbi:hypothetical protein PISMIDRAFT_688864 [Pisolithus microcarpus 441]|uniref:Uncharacterized protein n=1 Tax=Pisolithus microcarpus 441 TaxID=765257 RepID=A0A0C9XLN2_9AGAM|nr:hypothetical protein PISMIDRAFT_688864 [Pisolithus microcarpus 441]
MRYLAGRELCPYLARFRNCNDFADDDIGNNTLSQWSFVKPNTNVRRARRRPNQCHSEEVLDMWPYKTLKCSANGG